jgi:uncharacterized repeat protein (TIGR02543 family)
MKKLLLVVFIFVLTSITLFACSDKVKVTFDSAGGSAVQSQTLEKGATVEKPDAPTKEGYVFEGWYFENKKWNFDEIKLECAIQNGYDVLTVWESEYKENKEATIQKCIAFLISDYEKVS